MLLDSHRHVADQIRRIPVRSKNCALQGSALSKSALRLARMILQIQIAHETRLQRCQLAEYDVHIYVPLDSSSSG